MTAKAIWSQPLGTAPSAWAAAFGAEINSLAAGSTAVSSVVIDNTANLYTDGWVSLSLATLATGPGTPYVGLYLLPLNQDGVTYGDGTVSGTVAPSVGYWVDNITFAPSLASGTRVGSGYIGQLPPTKFVLAVVNEMGNAFAASGNTISFASDALNLNG